MKQIILILLLILLIGCNTKETTNSSSNAINLCIKKCKTNANTIDYRNGPCIGNPIIDNWVCDISHIPRRAVDNLPENQCSAFIEKTASHFVELNEDCELVKVY